jgi:putative membrane-bound dehydrogenase-like protein
MIPVRLIACIAPLVCLAPSSVLVAAPEPVPIGVARIDITPSYPVRLSGYGSRREEHESVHQRIWAKALAIGADQDGPAVLLTVDNCGISADMRADVLRRLRQRTKLTDERFAICSSHTHCAPMINGVLPNLFSTDIPPEHQRNIDRYTRDLTDMLEKVALEALAGRQPAQLAWAVGKTDFARNRRGVQTTPTGVGPVDHDVPVLRVSAPDGKLRAVLLNYACHCTTLSFNSIHGDWAGCAMEYLEQDFPGVIALTAIGCGADQNPDPRRTVELVEQHGRKLADEVKRLLQGELTPVSGKLECRTKSIELPFDTPRPRAEWEERAASKGANIAYRAQKNLERLDRGEALPTKLPYLVQSWAFGDDLAMVFLPGEVVVDYSLRLKREFDRARLWVNGYANDVPCYIPSERVLKEGGYEGETAMVYYDRPNKFAPGVENLIVNAVHEITPRSFLAANKRASITPALTPAEGLAAVHTRPGFTVELVAAEPLVIDPVAIDFGLDGGLWVVEMHDYPTGLDGNWQPGGRIRRLTDTDGDGRYDAASLFLEGIPFPTGVMAWRKGVLVCAAPDILYAEDTDNDGRADKLEKLFTGFITDNYQARVNSLALGLDNWVYGANGLRGGVITPAGQASSLSSNQSRKVSGSSGTPDLQAVDISGRDFRLQPDTLAFEPVSGLTQQGRVRDDWGNWFGCNNSHLIWHFPLPDHYLRRNPHVTTPTARADITTGETAHRVFPVSETLERFNRPDHVNRVTSGCGLGIYRDDLLGKDVAGDAFVCEPVHNLVTRLKLDPRGPTFTSRRAPGEEQSEFFASADNWSRPVQAITGPDGALWIVDMYRFVIEHPRWIPAERLAELDVRAGAGRGRIYRVFPRGAKLRPVRDLTKLSPTDLAGALDTPNGTVRDMVHRELLHRHDSSWKGSWSSGAAMEHDAATDALQTLLTSAANPAVRLQALCALDGINALSRSVLVMALDDKNPDVRSHAIRLCEPKPARVPPGAKPAWKEKADTLAAQPTRGDWRLEFLLKTTEDADICVRYQFAFTLGEWEDARAGEALAKLAVRDMGDEWMRAALLSSTARHATAMLKAVLATPDNAPGRGEMVGQLIATVTGNGGEAALGELLVDLAPAAGRAAEPWQWTALASLQDALDRRRVRIESFTAAADARVQESAGRIEKLYASAHDIAQDGNAAIDVREAAIRLHGRGFNRADTDVTRLVGLLPRLADRRLETATLEMLRRTRDEMLPRLLLADWTQFAPSLRLLLVELLVTRDDWTKELLLGVERGAMSPGEIPIGRKDLLTRHRNDEIKALAMRILGPQANADRAKILAQYQAALTLRGDRERGKASFAKNCAQCHALDGQGFVVGPDLAAFRSKPAADWLVAILDPNAVIEPRFVNYNVEMKDGRSLSGLVTEESATGFTLVQAGGLTQTLRRADVAEMRASTLSLMPEGLEQAMSPQETADLLVYLRGAP